MTFQIENRTELLTDWLVGSHTLLVAIAVYIGESDERWPAMVDTACGPCVISARQAIDYGWIDSPELEIARISTRFGTFQGVVDRFPIRIKAREAELPVECTWLIIEDWPGPVVLGWRGCLERFRFATDPMDNWFYFAEP